MKILTIGIVAAGAGVLFAVLACTRSSSRPDPDDPGAARAEAVFSSLISLQEPGAAVLVVKDGRTVFKRSFGLSDLESGRPIDGRTNFRLASLTKQFTASAVMLLVRDGRLRYDDALTGVFPDFPEYGREVTVRRLLQHTSGLPDYENLMSPDAFSEMDSGRSRQISDTEVLRLLKRTRSPDFVPGTKWKYSNSGYVVLGLIVEKIAGSPFDEFLRDRVFLPLGMDGTLAYVRGKNKVADRAYGHGRKGGVWVESDQSPTSATLGDGGIYSSLDDLAKWDEALRRGSFFTPEEMRAATTPVQTPSQPPVEPNGTPAAYGFGWFLNPWKGHPRMWHYGETRGFRTAIERFPEDGLTVVVLANRSDLDAAALALKTANVYLSRSD